MKLVFPIFFAITLCAACTKREVFLDQKDLESKTTSVEASDTYPAERRVKLERQVFSQKSEMSRNRVAWGEAEARGIDELPKTRINEWDLEDRRFRPKWDTWRKNSE